MNWETVFWIVLIILSAPLAVGGIVAYRASTRTRMRLPAIATPVGGYKGRMLAKLGSIALVSSAVILAGCGSGTTNVTIAEPAQAGIDVSGEGRVFVTPDIGQISVGVQLTRPTVAEARNAAAQAMTAVRASVKSNGVDDKDIATSGFSIYPQYASSRNEPRPRITGYQVSNQMTVKVRKLDDTAKVLDEAVAAGGDDVRVNDIRFTASEPAKYQAEARDKAFDDAKGRAEQLAKRSGVALGTPLHISENSGGVYGPAPRGIAEAAGGDISTPLDPGQTEIVVIVAVTFAIE